MVLTRSFRFSSHVKRNTLASYRRRHSEPSRLRLRRRRKKEGQLSADDPYIFHPLVRTIEPVSQALRLTKTVVNEGLPPVIATGMSALPFEDVLPQIKRSIMTDEYFDCAEKIKFGQRYKRLLANVVKSVWSAAASYPGLLKQAMSFRPDLKVAWRRMGYNLQVSGRTGILLSSSADPLPCFAVAAEVEKTKELPVHVTEEIISPVFELSQNSSKAAFDSGFYNDIFSFPRTLIIAENNWKLPHLTAQGIMFSFGRLLERAICRDKASFGETLECPLSLRSVVCNDQKMALLCYQLNTLDLENDEGVKNQLWLIPEIPIRFNNLFMSNQNHDESLAFKFPENELKTLIAVLLYGEDEERVSKVVTAT